MDCTQLLGDEFDYFFMCFNFKVMRTFAKKPTKSFTKFYKNFCTKVTTFLIISKNSKIKFNFLKKIGIFFIDLIKFLRNSRHEDLPFPTNNF